MARYAFSDLHGRLDLFKRICDFIQPDDELYCLGDCGDRGPQSWETIKAVLTHPQVHYLKGNHEDMLVKAYFDYQKYDYYTDAYYLLCYNGGIETFIGLINEPYAKDWAIKLKELPNIATIKNNKGDIVIMSHAGYTPGGPVPVEEDLLWDRSHFYDPFPEEKFPNTVMIHGHTPMSYMIGDGVTGIDPKTLAYDNGHKIDIDSGAVNTGIAILIDLDTYEIHKIYGEEFDYLKK